MQQRYQCPNCGSPVPFGSRFCASCGTPLNWPVQPQMQPPPVYEQQPGRWGQQPMPLENTSGHGKLAVIPHEIRGWNWGAFFFGALWGICNSVWISLLALIPGLNLVMFFVLGAKGNEWAWQSKRWDSVEHFRKTQRSWRNWGIGILLVGIVFYFLLIIGGVFTAGEFLDYVY